MKTDATLQTKHYEAQAFNLNPETGTFQKLQNAGPLQLGIIIIAAIAGFVIVNKKVEGWIDKKTS